MRKLLLIFATSLALSGCGVVSALTGIPPSPVSVANQTKLDEQVGLTVTLAYTAAARAAALAIRLGIVNDTGTIAKIGELDGKAFAAVKAVRDAYDASNSASYLSALTKAREAVASLLAAVSGPVAAMDPPVPGPALTYHAVLVRDLHASASAILLTDYRLASTKGN